MVGSSLFIFGGVSIGPGDDVHEKDDLWRFDLGELARKINLLFIQVFFWIQSIVIVLSKIV